VERKKVLFLCIGNACRSQMAEAFARTYGRDVMEPLSAGLSPASGLPPLTFQVMSEKGIALDHHYPKDVSALRGHQFDLVVNMSGQKLPAAWSMPIEEWNVHDPIGESEDVYRSTRDDIENRVMRLILTLRRNGKPVPKRVKF
jgi:arsenate reductase (thioredoxin)